MVCCSDLISATMINFHGQSTDTYVRLHFQGMLTCESCSDSLLGCPNHDVEPAISASWFAAQLSSATSWSLFLSLSLALCLSLSLSLPPSLPPSLPRTTCSGHSDDIQFIVLFCALRSLIRYAAPYVPYYSTPLFWVKYSDVRKGLCILDQDEGCFPYFSLLNAVIHPYYKIRSS